jgi:predicted nuclease of restriction endonuclease-like RecB superfamily
MPLLQVRNFPEGLYAQIGMAAEREHRTIAQQTIVLLEKSLGQTESNKERRLRLIEKCNARVISDEAKAIDDAALIREDRNR